MHADTVSEGVCKSIVVGEMLHRTACTKHGIFSVLPSDEMLDLWPEGSDLRTLNSLNNRQHNNLPVSQ
jgi:hypothetical protein